MSPAEAMHAAAEMDSTSAVKKKERDSCRDIMNYERKQEQGNRNYLSRGIRQMRATLKQSVCVWKKKDNPPKKKKHR